MVLRITQYGEPVLQKKGKKIERFDGELGAFAGDLVETMRAHNGIGLAAQQVDKTIMLCVVDLLPAEADLEINYSLDGRRPPLELLMPLVLANPAVESYPEPCLPYEEGCLSFPDIQGEVIRPDCIKVAYQDLEGKPHTLACDGLLGRVIQHEVDHLNGILFIERMKPEVRKTIEGEIRSLKRRTRKFLQAGN